MPALGSFANVYIDECVRVTRSMFVRGHGAKKRKVRRQRRLDIWSRARTWRRAEELARRARLVRT